MLFKNARMLANGWLSRMIINKTRADLFETSGCCLKPVVAVSKRAVPAFRR